MTKTSSLVFYGLNVLLIALGVLAISNEKTGDPHLKSLGEALAIAGLLGLTVDWYLKKE